MKAALPLHGRLEAAVAALLLPFTATESSAQCDCGGPSFYGQHYIIPPPVNYYEYRSGSRARAEDESYSYEYSRAEPPIYFYDTVNRRPALTPEPVWRSMFASMRQRIDAEIRAFDSPGLAAGERRYYRSFFRSVEGGK